MPLRFRDETAPDVEILHRPLIRPLEEDVVRHNVVVAKGWHDGDHIVVGSSAVLVRHAKHLPELLDQKLVLAYDLLLRARMLLVIVVPRRVARPDDEVDVVPDILLDPSERLVDQREGGVAPRRLRAIDACGSSLAVTCRLRSRARVRLVERVWVEVCVLWSAPKPHCAPQ
jgi:hypothetical protein